MGRIFTHIVMYSLLDIFSLNLHFRAWHGRGIFRQVYKSPASKQNCATDTNIRHIGLTTGLGLELSLVGQVAEMFTTEAIRWLASSWLVRRYRSDAHQSELGEVRSLTRCCRTPSHVPCHPTQTCSGAASPIQRDVSPIRWNTHLHKLRTFV